MNLRKMTKQQLVEYGGSIGIRLDLKHKKDDLINQLTQKSKFCTECGQDISQSNDGFCFNCGAKIENNTNVDNTVNTTEDITPKVNANINKSTYSNTGKIKGFINHVRDNVLNKIIAKADAKIKERELLSFKAELAREHKDISDYTDEQVNLILSDKREKIIAKIKDKSLIGLLITLLIGI